MQLREAARHEFTQVPKRANSRILIALQYDSSRCKFIKYDKILLVTQLEKSLMCAL